MPADPISATALPDGGHADRRIAPWWLRPAGLALLVVVMGLTLRDRPDEYAHGLDVLALAATAAVAVGGAGLLVELPRGRPTWLTAALFALLIAGSVVVVAIEPDGPGFVGGFVTTSVAASSLPRRPGQAVVAFTLVGIAVAGHFGGHRSWTTILIAEAGALAFFRLGQYARQLRARTEQAERLLAEVQRTRSAYVRAATLAERQRLAREMHDVLAHSLSGLLVHLEGARLLAVQEGAGPGLINSLDRARGLAQAGLGEARQAIGVLRDEDLPGPDRLPALAGELERDLGIACRVEVRGTPYDLGPQARLTLYRVAQEALTNVRRHAHPDRIDVCLSYQPGGTRLTVEDVAASAASELAAESGRAPGYGVSGMRERAELLGGELTAEPTATGFRVTLWLPVRDAEMPAGGDAEIPMRDGEVPA
ncbi:sensor histidine kinase [Actinopolymorpha singaporensis]|uniref:sensor histidine kinase n=1 Tax=Actinopolymorpha singaporensis TaxID=117157 RepID=UPI0012FE4A96|nr:sensor histidine kinase [Actinopolymorpha singaporensis]